jgi:hydroxyacylglutathione hydrolase
MIRSQKTNVRIGLDNIYGYIPSTERFAGNLDQSHFIPLKELKALKGDPNVSDRRSRGATEFNAGHMRRS